jgi:hypothetical protein
MEAPLIYRSYLLRLWQVREEAGLAWRATLKNARTSEQRGFASLEELIAYLRQVTVEPIANDGDGVPDKK